MEGPNTLCIPKRARLRSISSESTGSESGFGGSTSDIKESLSNITTEECHSQRHNLSVAHNINKFGVSENDLSKPIMKRSLSMFDRINMVNCDENVTVVGKTNILEKKFPIEYLKKIIQQGIRRKSRWLIETALSLASDKNMQIICREFCKEKPQFCFASRIIIEKIKQRVLLEMKNECEVLSVWVGRHVKVSSGIDTIVLVTNPPKPCELRDTFWGLRLKIRCVGECSTEAARLLVHDMNDFSCSLGVQIKDADINALLFTHSNITLINTSNVCSSGYDNLCHRIEWVPSIVIYCHVKGVIPIGERAFPKRIGGQRVDVREAVCDFAANPVQISEQIGNKDLKTTGTLGGFVTLQNPERQAFLTCAHVVLPSKALKKRMATEYSRKREIHVVDKNESRIGRVNKAEFRYGRTNEVSVDAALVEITDQDRLPPDGKFANVYATEQLIGAGFSERNIPQFAKGETEEVKTLNFRKPVLKIGAKSGLTIGTLKIGKCCANVIDYDVCIEDMATSVTLCKQMEVLPHFDPSKTSESQGPFLDNGDSGSFVFFISQEDPLVLKCIGLAVAKTSYGSCLMTPIGKVFDALDLPHDCLSKFTMKVMQEEINPDILSILNDISSKMATKDDIKKMEEKMQIINERLSATESDVKTLIERKKEAS